MAGNDGADDDGADGADAVLDAVLEALANPHRRAIVHVRRTDLRVRPPTDEVQRAWGEWFTMAGPHLVDPGSPFGHGVELTADGRTELDLQSPSPLVGYCILNAGSLAEAEALVRDMPIIDSVRVYEAHSL